MDAAELAQRLRELVVRLAGEIPDDDEGFCFFCSADIHGLAVAPRPHADDCLWDLARQWKEEWA
jgi:hypothetical protein